MCENFLLLYHKSDFINFLGDSEKDKYFSVNINFIELLEFDPKLGNKLLSEPENALKLWNQASFNVQRKLLEENDKTTCTIKNNVTCRIYSLPPWSHISFTTFPRNAHTEKFIQISGTITRMSAKKLLEYQRQYLCTKCKYPITVEAEFDKMNIIKAPKTCTNPEGCAGKHIITFGELDPYNCRDYQELKIQEDLSKPGIGSTPNHMVVILEDDLVDTCKPGENVTICGVFKRRWSEFSKGDEMKIDMALKANHVQVNNNTGSAIQVSDDLRCFFKKFWQEFQREPLTGRNVILRSIAPELHGLQLVKLATAIVLAGGTQTVEDSHLSTDVQTRAESHVLLVGDPGTGKSEMLRFASKIVRRSVLTTGVGSTAAGLTVTAVMDKGQWQLEAGALVMSDGGICCIDEFNSMKEHDRTSIHEAMEQQTISVAKGGIVCKLKTRCSILAACNPKGNIDLSKPLCMNIAMSSPLLSRFDLIMLIRDTVNSENDKKLAQNFGTRKDKASWDLEKLQAYFVVIKEFYPKLTDDAEVVLSTYYQLQRKLDGRNKSRTTVRLLESLIRLSQGHAKLMFHSEVQVIDTIFAVILVDAALDYESSLLSLKISNNCFSDDPETTYQQLAESILRKLSLGYIWDRELDRKAKNTSTSREVSSGNLFETSAPDNLKESINHDSMSHNPHILTSTQSEESVNVPTTSKHYSGQDIFNNISKENQFSSFSQSITRNKVPFPRFATKFDNENEEFDLDKPSNIRLKILARMKSQANIEKKSTLNNSDNVPHTNFSQNSESGYLGDTKDTSDTNQINVKQQQGICTSLFKSNNVVDDDDFDLDKPSSLGLKILARIKSQNKIPKESISKSQKTIVNNKENNSKNQNLQIDNPPHVGNTSVTVPLTSRQQKVHQNPDLSSQSLETSKKSNVFDRIGSHNLDDLELDLDKPYIFKSNFLSIQKSTESEKNEIQSHEDSGYSSVNHISETNNLNNTMNSQTPYNTSQKFKETDDQHTKINSKAQENNQILLETSNNPDPSKLIFNTKSKTDMALENSKNLPRTKSKFDDINFDDFYEESEYSNKILSRIKSKANLGKVPSKENLKIKQQKIENKKQVLDMPKKITKTSQFKPKFSSKVELNSDKISKLKNLVGSDLNIDQCLNDTIKTSNPICEKNNKCIEKQNSTTNASLLVNNSCKIKKNDLNLMNAFGFNPSDSKVQKYNKMENISGFNNIQDNKNNDTQLKPTEDSKIRQNLQISEEPKKKIQKLNGPAKFKKKTVDELDTLKNIPSVNDDFVKFNLNFDGVDWDDI